MSLPRSLKEEEKKKLNSLNIMKGHIAHISIFHMNFTSSKRMRDVALFLLCSPPSTSLFIGFIWASFFSSHESWVFPADGQRIEQEIWEDWKHLIGILDTGFKTTPCTNCLRKFTLTQKLRNVTYNLFWCILFKRKVQQICWEFNCVWWRADYL